MGKTNNVARIKQHVEEVSPLTVAVVYAGTREVRRYSLIDHGESFAKLAEEYAEKVQGTVKLIKAVEGIKCPSCGHIFNPAE